jgi:hypothetical protein
MARPQFDSLVPVLLGTILLAGCQSSTTTGRLDTRSMTSAARPLSQAATTEPEYITYSYPIIIGLKYKNENKQDKMIFALLSPYPASTAQETNYVSYRLSTDEDGLPAIELEEGCAFVHDNIEPDHGVRPQTTPKRPGVRTSRVTVVGYGTKYIVHVRNGLDRIYHIADTVKVTDLDNPANTITLSTSNTYAEAVPETTSGVELSDRGAIPPSTSQYPSQQKIGEFFETMTALSTTMRLP